MFVLDTEACETKEGIGTFETGVFASEKGVFMLDTEV